MGSISKTAKVVEDNRLKIDATVTFTEIAGSINESKNTSQVRISVSATQSSSPTFSGSQRNDAGKLKVWVNGTTYTWGLSLYNTPFSLSASKDITITHDEDGTKTIEVWLAIDQGNGNYSGDTWVYQSTGWGSASTLTLTAIPRKSKISLEGGITSAQLGSTVGIVITPYVSTYSHKFYYKFPTDSSSTAFSNNVTTAGGRTQSWATLADFAKKIKKNPAEEDVSIICETYKSTSQTSANLVGSSTVTLKLIVPDTYVPTIGSISVAHNGNPPISGQTTLYVQNNSNIKFTFNNIGKSYEADIAEYKIELGSNDDTMSAASTTNIVTISKPTMYGTSIPYTATITDVRGKTAKKSGSITIYQYTSPKITAYKAWRTNNAGTSDDGTGTKVKFSCNYDIASVNNKNTFEIILQYKEATNSTYTDIQSLTRTSSTQTAYSGAWTGIVTATFDGTKTYNFRIRVKDGVMTSYADINFLDVQTEYTLLNFGKSGRTIAIGGQATDDGNSTGSFEVFYPSYFSEPISAKNGIVVHSAIGTSGTEGFIRFAKISITKANRNVPIEMTITRRGDYSNSRINIAINDVSNYSAAIVKYFYCEGPALIFYQIVTENTERNIYLYAAKTEADDRIEIFNLNLASYMRDGVYVTFLDNQYNALPSDAIAATQIITTLNNNGIFSIGPVNWIEEEGNVDMKSGSTVVGTWYYRKWHNGTAECWGACNVTVTGGLLWATPLYYSKEGTGQVSYPFTFKARPEEIVAISYATIACWIYKEAGTSGQNTTTKTANYKAIKANNFDNASNTIVFSFSVKGQWK